MASLTCLLVEDSHVQARVIGTMFRPLGWTVLIAFDLRSALQTLAEQQVDLVLTDLILPDANDQSPVWEVRRAQPGVIVAAMTAGGTGINARDALLQARHDGAEFLLPKPFDEDRLRNVLAEVQERLVTNHKKPLVLVVDDSRAVRSFCRKALIERGFRVVEAGSLDEAVQQVDVLDLSAIVCDLFMPGMPVLENLPILRQHLMGVGFVSISGSDGKDGALRQALAAGADVALCKPFTADELAEAVRKAQVLAAAQLIELMRNAA